MKILLYDLETSPAIGYFWGLSRWEQNVIDVIHESRILSFAYTWLGSGQILCHRTIDYRNKHGLLKELHSLMSQADVVIAHNGDKFDQKLAKTAFIKAGLKPPSPFKSIDTLNMARKHFQFSSNKLNDLGKVLGVGQKLKHTGFDLWLGCLSGDKESWRLMTKYNIQDVKLLEKVYLKLRPWIENHPTTYHEQLCRNCSSPSLQKRGFNYTTKNVQQRYQCKDCGAWSSRKIKK